MWLAVGGFACGLLAGAAARHGRMCTMAAAEDALVAGDYRALKAWGIALAVAMTGTQLASHVMAVDLTRNVYTAGPVDIGGAVLGGILFGLGMALVGTCSFGLLVRAGGGDLKAVITATVIGITAFSFTGGMLAEVRPLVSGRLAFDPKLYGGPSLPELAHQTIGLESSVDDFLWPALIVGILIVIAARDRRLRRRPRQLAAGVLIGAAVASGWMITASAVDTFETTRLESLSFVAPVGRMLMQIMSGGMRDVSFGVSSVAGVVCGAFVVSLAKRELRADAFDDPREMHRHLLGAVLMGCGGVLSRGCTIGQGLSAASILAITAPFTIAGILGGARIGLFLLLEWPELVARLPGSRRRR